MFVMSVYLLHKCSALAQKGLLNREGVAQTGDAQEGFIGGNSFRLYRQVGTQIRSQSAELPKVSLRTPGQVQ